MHLILCLLLQIQPQGLEPGERFLELAPSPPSAAHALPDNGVGYGRILDAFTGRPIFGADVEIWSEEINPVFGGFHRIGEARSGRDGRFAIQRWSGSETGEKMRIRAPGYLTLSTTAGEIYDDVVLFPAEAAPFRFRVLDSRGRPIAGAQFTSTYSCSHDIPAFDVRTDSRGIAECPEFGLQDDIPELRLRARGHAAIEYLDADAGLEGLQSGEPFDVYLPRRRPFAVRVLDREGAPLAGAPIFAIDDECYHVVYTDKEGLVRIESRYGHGELSIYVLDSPQNDYIAYFTPPRERVVTLRPHAEEWPEETPLGRVRIEWGGRAEEIDGVPLQLYHENGWTEDFGRERDKPVEFPAGEGFLLFGGAFSGFERELHDFELAAGGELVIRPRLVREPRVTVQWPEKIEGLVWIEAGDETLEEIKRGQALPVPAGQPLCVFLDGADRKLRLLADEAVDGMVLDLGAGEVVEPPRPAAVESVAVELRFASSDGGELVGRIDRLAGHPGCTLEPDDEDAPAARFTLRGPLGAPWLARFQAKGHQAIWLRGRLAEGTAPIERVVMRTASVRIEAPFEVAILGEDGEPYLEDQPPGPLFLVLQRPDGRRHGLELMLRPGAERVIALR